MSKFIDLKDMIHAETRDQVYLDEVGEVLEWLDAHPDQVPGRTITESEFHEVADAHRNGGIGAADLAHGLGVIVVPDLGPTNEDRLAKLLEDNGWVGLEVNESSTLAKCLDKAGVKAPEADDD